MSQSRRRAFSLVEILVVIVIIGILAAVILPTYLKSGGKSPSGRVIESPIQRGNSVQCFANLGQIRQAYQMATSSDETKPASLADLRQYGVSESMTACTVTKQPYTFDPNTGQVRCPQHPEQ